MVSHSVLLVVGGALLTGLLGALVFGSNTTAEERRVREEQKLLRALEAQRRIRDAQLRAQPRQRGARRVESPASAPLEVQPTAEAEPEIDHRATERRRRREEKEHAAALAAEREAARRAQRQATQEQKSAAKAERSTLRAAQQQQRRDEKEKAVARKAEQETQVRAARAAEEQRKREAREHAVAAKAQRDAEERARRRAELETKVETPAAPQPDPARAKEDGDKPLSELPLYMWAIEAEERDAAP